VLSPSYQMPVTVLWWTKLFRKVMLVDPTILCLPLLYEISLFSNVVPVMPYPE
jgi:hypothetical protein